MQPRNSSRPPRSTPENFLYGSISTRFKPGNGNPGTAPLVAFYYQDSNLQYHAENVISFDGGVDNLPHVNIHGVEVEFNALNNQLVAQYGETTQGYYPPREFTVGIHYKF
jgi:hypothetical protein